MEPRPVNQKAWWLVLPVLICVAFSAVLPLMTVVNYSVQDTFGRQPRSSGTAPNGSPP
jgi:glycerol transport system permease protein